MQRQVMQATFCQTAVMDIAQMMYGLRQAHRLTLQLRQEILQLRRVRMHIRQVGAYIRIADIRQTDSRHIAFQDGLAVIPQRYLLKCQRVERTP